MFIDFLIGGIGGIVSRSAVAPIELNRIQKQNYFIPNSTLRDVYKKEGLRFFWKGNGTNCIRVFPQIAINYSIFRQTKPYFKTIFDNKGPLRSMRFGKFPDAIISFFWNFIALDFDSYLFDFIDLFGQLTQRWFHRRCTMVARDEEILQFLIMVITTYLAAICWFRKSKCCNFC